MKEITSVTIDCDTIHHVAENTHIIVASMVEAEDSKASGLKLKLFQADANEDTDEIIQHIKLIIDLAITDVAIVIRPVVSQEEIRNKILNEFTAILNRYFPLTRGSIPDG